MADISHCVLFVGILNFFCLKALCGPISESLAESLVKVLDIPTGGGGRVRGPPPQYMLELYSDATSGIPSGDTSAPYGASTITAVPVTEGKGDTFFFLPPNISNSEELLAVEFHLYHGHLRGAQHHTSARLRSALYKVEASVRGSVDTYTQLVAGTGGGWLRFMFGRSSVLPEFERECSNSDDDIDKTNHTDNTNRSRTSVASCPNGLIAISVKATAEDGRPVRMRLHHGDNVAARKSILVFFTKSLNKFDHLPLPVQKTPESPHDRVRRSLLAASVLANFTTGPLLNSSQGTGETHSCVRQPLMINFREIGWAEWIIAPQGFNAYFCSGSCGFPLGQHQNPTNHATLMSLVRAIVEDSQASAPHCVPISYTGLALLYVDNNNNVVLKNYDDMVVQACGCR